MLVRAKGCEFLFWKTLLLQRTIAPKVSFTFLPQRLINLTFNSWYYKIGDNSLARWDSTKVSFKELTNTLRMKGVSKALGQLDSKYYLYVAFFKKEICFEVLQSDTSNKSRYCFVWTNTVSSLGILKSDSHRSLSFQHVCLSQPVMSGTKCSSA